MEKGNTFFCGISIALVGVLLAGTLGQAQPPNIIHIMVDDAGTGDFTSYWEDSPVSTPNIDQLASDGMKFTRAYAGASNCAPSRSALMTGFHGGHTYMRTNPGSTSIRDADVTIAEMLQTAGYATAGYGKWGLGAPGSPGAPERQGFDEFVGYYDQVHAHYHFPDRLYDSGNPLLIPENNGFNEPETGLVSNTRVHAHSIVFDRMNQFVRTNSQSGTPFYAWGAWTPPHRRSTLNQSEADPGGLYQRYADVPGWDNFDKIQAGFVSWIDEQVGELRQTLADPNQDGDTSDSVLDNTLIVFTSDNGGWGGGHAWDRNRETVNGQTVNLRGNKEGFYEGGLRVPMIAYWPGTVAAGSTSDTPVAFYDYMTTFAELAGVQQVPPSDGTSFAPTLTGVGTQQTREGMYFEGYRYNPNGVPTQVVHVDGWKLIRTGNNNQLFDLNNDPTESTNRYNDPTVLETRAKLHSYMLRNATPITSQLSLLPSNVGTSNAQRDGVISQGIRPENDTRDWTVAGSGDAKNVTGRILKQGNEIAAYLDDLHMQYEFDVELTRTQATASPLLEVSLVGQSGFHYFSGSIDTTNIPVGVPTNVSVRLDYENSSPSTANLAADLGSHLSIALSYQGDTGQLLYSDISLVGQQPTVSAIPQLGDLSGDGSIDANDWSLFRQNLFQDLRGITNVEALQRGDLNQDGVNNELDFLLFQQIYDGLHGTNALQALSQVPEPSSILYLLGLGIVIAQVRSRRVSQ